MSQIILELTVIVVALLLLLGDLWATPHKRRLLGYAAAACLAMILGFSFIHLPPQPDHFNNMIVSDALSLFFKRFFLIAAIVVLLICVDFSDRVQTGITEYFSIILFALSGMMFAASANDFVMVFVSLELISVSFYILNSFQRNRLQSLEAGIKYLILSALSAAFLVFGIALVFGTAETTNFTKLAEISPLLAHNSLFLLGLLMVLVGLGFKIAAFPFQIWAPDVYQGSPAPSTAFLAVGSKAAGIVLLMRVLFLAVPAIAIHWNKLFIIISAITILYGNLCALPQRNLKRLLGYSSISNAGYLLLGFAAVNSSGNTSGLAAALYYLAGYLFTVLAAFAVITIVTRNQDSDDITVLAGLNQRSPFLATVLTLSMVSLAGIPPLAGFFGKFLLLKSVIEQGPVNHGYYCLIGVAIVGVVISLYYYFGVIRAIYWSKDTTDFTSITISLPTKAALMVCVAGMLYLGTMPNDLVEKTNKAVAPLSAAIPHLPSSVASK